jgi:hypothetical protein
MRLFPSLLSALLIGAVGMASLQWAEPTPPPMLVDEAA